MNRAWIVWMVAACGATSAPPVVATAPPVSDAAVAPAASKMPPKMIDAGPLLPRIELRPGGAITAVDAVAEGDAAITLDAVGGVRLWPTLDGTREPCLVDLSDVHDLTVAHHDRDFFVAFLDGARDLVLVVIDDRGRVLRRLSVSHDARYAGLAMTSIGVLAWSEDQTVGLWSFEGVLLDHLGTDPGQRIRTIVANGAHAIAELEVDQEHAIVRELVTQPKLAWALPLATEGEPTGPLAISPSGKIVAFTVKDRGLALLRVFDRVTGEALARAIVPPQIELGFTDDHHLAVAKSTGVLWLELAPSFKTEALPPTSAVSEIQSRTIAIAAGVVLRGEASSVMIVRPGSETYLGYGLAAPSFAALGPSGHIVIGSRGVTAQLDDHLLEVSGTALKLPAEGAVSELVWLGGPDFIASLTGLSDVASSQQLVSREHEPSVLSWLLPTAPERLHLSGISDEIIRYLPANQLVTVSFGEQARVERWNAVQRKLERVVMLPPNALGESHELVPLDPAVANGAELIDVRVANKTTVTWTDLTAKKKLASAEVVGFVAADPAGRVYAWVVNADSGIDLAVLTRGVVTNVLARPPAQFTLWPEPTGSGAIELSKDRVAMVRLDGTVAWERSIVGGVRALWPSPAVAVIATTTGIVQLDAKTGAMLGARCGWRFGLSDKPQPASPPIEPICAAL